MLTTRDVIAGKIAVQMGLVDAETIRRGLRQMDGDQSPQDLINRLHAARRLDPQAIEFLRHRVALYEHVRWEAVYVRLLERGTTVKKDTVAKLLAELEHMTFRRRLGELLVSRGNLKPEYDQSLIEKQRRMIQQDDERILERYRASEFSGVTKPLIPNSRLEPHEFKISTLFRSKETRALVGKAELELLRAEALAAQEAASAAEEDEEQGGADKTMIMDTPLAAAGHGGAGKTLIMDGPPGAPSEEADLVATTKLPPGSVAQTKAAMEAMQRGTGHIDALFTSTPPPADDQDESGTIVALGSGRVARLGSDSAWDQLPPDESSEEDEIPTLKSDGPLPADPPPPEAAPAPAAKKTGSLRTLDDVRSLKRIGNYDVVEVLGVGGMGAVFLGQQEGVGEFVAIKVLLQALASSEEKGRFKREVELAQRIQHPNILHVIEAGESREGLTYMVVPALAGKELRELIDLSPGVGLAPPLVLTIMRQLLSGMQAVHEAGVVHRDLKPENVFVLAGGLHDIKVMDFGLAKPAEEAEAEMSPDMFRTVIQGEASGSPQYIAPESVTCDPVDGRTDIYSIGVMFFEMLTGKLPLESETTQGFLSQHLICPPLTLEEACDEYAWPEQLQGLLDRMLAKTRADRPESCAAILAELDAGLAPLISGLKEKEKQVLQRTVVLPAGPKDNKKWGFKGLLGRLLGSS